jgi:RNA polymerase sigma factor (sigma-70 family)
VNGRQLPACTAIDGQFACPNVSDGELLERFVKRRDESAFAALVVKHGPMVFGVCRRRLHQAQDAEDAFQATFLILVRKAASIGKRELLGNWLYGVAVRVAARARLVAARRHARETTDMERIAVATRKPVESAELPECLEQEIQRLPAKYRGPVVLCYLEGRTNEEAASELNWPVGTVKGRLARARELLRKRLTRRGLAYSVTAIVTALSADALAVSLPPVLLDSTLKAALCFAAGDVAASGLVSAQAAALTKGVLHTMFVTKMKTLAVLVLALVTVVGGAGGLTYHLLAAEDEAKKTDKDRIQGTWKVDSAKVNGVELQGAEGDRVKGSTWTIGDEKITVTFNGEDRVSTYKLDPAAKPKTIDVLTEKEGTFKGIYKLEKDTLTICATLGRGATERPAEFDSKEGSSTMLLVLKRKK